MIDDPETRAALTSIGLSDTDAVSFRAAKTVTVWDRDSDYAVIGAWNIDEIPVCVHRVTGEVFTAPPWSDEMDPLNTSVRTFAESLAAVDRAKPLSAVRYGTNVAASDQVKAFLEAIDADVLADPYSFWQTIIDDIKNGLYVE
ncbi:SUKH-4 family immunity protein [Actinomadura sp. 1N219]|uniref:SUKH-4 family immunity protein n=1 Tax=Actinomadura sp. 1N219 TaxID=3375152 RepID=UPI0037A6ABA5